MVRTQLGRYIYIEFSVRFLCGNKLFRTNWHFKLYLNKWHSNPTSQILPVYCFYFFGTIFAVKLQNLNTQKHSISVPQLRSSHRKIPKTQTPRNQTLKNVFVWLHQWNSPEMLYLINRGLILRLCDVCGADTLLLYKKHIFPVALHFQSYHNRIFESPNQTISASYSDGNAPSIRRPWGRYGP